VVKYIGSKRLLIPAIVDAIREAWGTRWSSGPPRVLDLFSGTSRVGHALKRAGCAVIANDHNAYAHTLARCYIQTDLTPRLSGQLSRLIAEPRHLLAPQPLLSPEQRPPDRRCPRAHRQVVHGGPHR